MAGAAKTIGNVVISTCSERTPEWRDLVGVPLETDVEGRLVLPVARTLKEQDRMTALAEASQGEGMFSIRTAYEGHTDIKTYLHLRPIHFQLGKTLPVDENQLKDSVASVVRQWKLIVKGGYPCLADQKTPATAYVVGHTDRVGSETRNQRLSDERAKAIANALLKGGIAAMTDTPLTVCYLGRGEQESPTADEVLLPEARRADVIVTSGERPIRGAWTCSKKEK